MKADRAARLSTAAGLLVAGAGGTFVVFALVDKWSAVRSSLADARPSWLIAALLCAAAAMVAMALPWGTALALLHVPAKGVPIVRWYFLGEIGKYVPGGIWPVVGRAELAHRGGVPRPASYGSVALSLAALYLAAMLLVALLAPVSLLGREGSEALWVLALLPAGIVALHPRPLTWLVTRIERVLGRDLVVRAPSWSASVRLMVRYLPSWLLVGTATWCVARAFDGQVAWRAVAPAAVLSWIVGFVLIPVPGGVGVREAVFIALVSALPGSTAATVAIAARLCFIMVDAAGAGLGAMRLNRGRSRPTPAAADGMTSRS